MSLPRAVYDYARKRLDAQNPATPGRVVCASCGRWVPCFWHRTLDGTLQCYACSPEAEKQRVAARLANYLVRSNLIPAEVWDRAEREAANA